MEQNESAFQELEASLKTLFQRHLGFSDSAMTNTSVRIRPSGEKICVSIHEGVSGGGGDNIGTSPHTTPALPVLAGYLAGVAHVLNVPCNIEKVEGFNRKHDKYQGATFNNADDLARVVNAMTRVPSEAVAVAGFGTPEQAASRS